MTDPRFKFLLLAFTLFGLIGLKILYVNNHKLNYLFEGSTSLHAHVYRDSAEPGKKIGIILGSSAVSGELVPLATTVSDNLNRMSEQYITYNLATMQGTPMVAAIYLELAREFRKPDFVVIGVSPDFIPGEITYTPIAEYHFKHLQSYLTTQQINEFQIRAAKKNSLQGKVALLNRVTIPYFSMLKVREWMWHMKEQIFHQAMKKQIKPLSFDPSHLVSENNFSLQLLARLCQNLRENKIAVLLYMEPQYNPDFVYSMGSFQKYSADLKSWALAQGISLLDLVNLVPSTNEYFVDYIHLKPKGNHLVALKINEWLLEQEHSGVH